MTKGPAKSENKGTMEIERTDNNNNNNNNNEKYGSKKRPLNERGERNGNPITPDGEMPQKRFYRCRAHCNPLSHNDTFDYPTTPTDMDWSVHYPSGKTPTVLDIGCGFGGLTIALATILPDEFILGMEIRAKVCEYVRLRIIALRREHKEKTNATKGGGNDDDDDDETSLPYCNASVLRTNSMKFLPHYFGKGSMKKLFFCFPDPHFKRKNHGRRIVSERLLSEYAYLLQPRVGRLYCITDVKELHEWHVEHCGRHPLFRRLSEDECKDDPCVEAMQTTTEESQKVDRAGAAKYHAVYERIADADVAPVDIDSFFMKGEEEDTNDDANQ